MGRGGFQELNRITFGAVPTALAVGDFNGDGNPDLAVARSLGKVPREKVPDMPDRIIAATALSLGVPLITRDAAISASGIETIW